VCLNREQKEDFRESNIGYIFNFDYHGKGYATEACKAAINHAFDGLQAQRVFTGTVAENRASCRLLDRLGLKGMADGYTYAISRDEWEMSGKHGSV